MSLDTKRNMARVLNLIALTIFALTAVQLVRAQDGNRRLYGRVVDPTGASVSGVLIHVLDEGQDYSKSSGDFSVQISTQTVPGKRILIYVEKKGWHLSRPTDLWSVLPEGFEHTPLQILLAQNQKPTVATPTSGTPIEPDQKKLEDSECSAMVKSEDAAAKYLLNLTVSASFRSQSFNSPKYIKSIAPFLVENPRGRDNEGQGIVSGNSILYSTCLQMNGGPSGPGPVIISLHGRQITLDTGRLIWKLTGSKTKTQYASGGVLIALDNPDWGVLRSSRLLDVVDDSAQPRSVLLEVTAENLSDREIPLDNVFLRGTSRSHVSCANPAGPPQVVELRLPTGIAQGATDVPAGFTQMGDVHTSVVLSYQRSGCSGMPYYSMRIPVQVNIPPKQVIRVSFKISGDLGGLQTFRLGESFFLGWENVYVYLDSDDIQPQRVALDRGKSSL